MPLLAGKLYDPATAVTKNTTALLPMTALDTTNLRLTFTCPASGIVLVRMGGVVQGAATYPQILLGVLDGATVRGRIAPMGALLGTAAAATMMSVEASFVVTGLTASTSYTWDAAYAVEALVASTGIKYGGPNTSTTASDAFGGFLYEIWQVT